MRGFRTQVRPKPFTVADSSELVQPPRKQTGLNEYMWWKLAILIAATAGLIFCLMPMRTHAILFDPANPPPPIKWTFWSMVSNMYLTSSTVVLICAILAVAGYAAFKIVRNT